MNIFQAITTRKSVKSFDSKPVDDKLIGLMLHMATYAHSAGNAQEWEFVVVEDDEIKKRLANAALKQKQIAEAPVSIVVCADLDKISLKYGKRGEIFYAIQDTASAVTNMILTANALGLGTSWVAAFDEEDIKGLLELPDNLRPVAIISVGYPKEESEDFSRFPFEDLAYLNKYGNELFLEFEPIANALEEKVNEMKEKYKTAKSKNKLNFSDLLKKFTR